MLCSGLTIQDQRSVCRRFGADYVEAPGEWKVGIALATLDQLPLNGLRHPPEGDTTGWYLWGGEHPSQDPEFFQALHVEHLNRICPVAVPYLGLAPGWRFLLAPGHEDVWFDASLLEPE